MWIRRVLVVLALSSGLVTASQCNRGPRLASDPATETAGGAAAGDGRAPARLVDVSGGATAAAPPAPAIPSPSPATSATGDGLEKQLTDLVARLRAGSPRPTLSARLREAVATHGGAFTAFLAQAYTHIGDQPAFLGDAVDCRSCPRAAAPPEEETSAAEGEASEGGVVPAHPGCVALLALLGELPAHALDPAPYRLPEVTTALLRLRRFGEAFEEQRRSPFDDPEGRALWDAALLVLDEAPPAAVRERTRAVSADGASPGRLRTVARWLADLAAAENALREAWAVADVLLLRSFVRLAMDFRYLRRTNPYREPDELLPRLEKVGRKLLRRVERAREDLAEALRALPPQHPYYDRLRVFLPKYRELAAAAALDSFDSKRRLRRRHRGADVAALRERLRAEGFEPGPAGDTFDDALREAVIAFQSTRGIAPLGEVGPQTRDALNVTMDRRRRQIEVSLQRWRESPMRDAEGRYVRINIPRFELQLWDGAELRRRHEVIVGSGAVVTDLGARTIGYLNRTRLVSGAVDQIILNPYWRVPARIALQEIGPEAARDPEYLASHGFQVKKGSDGETLYVQRPGRKNPLGEVKFLFPNDYALYLHDTDKRWLFRETQRDFSHGCIRVHEPLDLARAIVEGDQGMGEAEFTRLRRMGTEYGIDLRTPVPIHVDYVTASVDEEGRLLLLPDVYRFDRDALRGRLPVRTKRAMKPAEIERAEARLRKKAGRD